MKLIIKFSWPVICMLLLIIAELVIYNNVGKSNYDLRCFIQVFGGASLFIMLLTKFAGYIEEKRECENAMKFKKSSYIYILMAFPGLLLVYFRIVLMLFDGINLEYNLESLGEVGDAIDCIFDVLHGVIIAPLLEELLFRKLMLSIYKSNVAKVIIVIISSIMFGYCHGEMPTRLNATFIGFVLGIIMLITKNIYICVLLHSEINILATILGFLSQKVEGILFAGSVIYVSNLILGIALGITSLTLIYLLYRRKGMYYGESH